MKMRFMKLAVLILSLMALSACVVAPSHPIGYRMTSTVLPTYVNGQYVGMQSGTAVDTTSTQTTTMTTTSSPPVTVQQTTTYIQPPAPSVVYVQTPTPVYYNPYYAPAPVVYPWPAFGIGVTYFRGGGWGGGWRGGHRGWRR